MRVKGFDFIINGDAIKGGSQAFFLQDFHKFRAGFLGKQGQNARANQRVFAFNEFFYFAISVKTIHAHAL